LRSTFLSTGLFNRAQALRSGHGLWWGSFRVRNEHRLVTVGWGGSGPNDHRGAIPTAKQARELLRLVKLIVPPLSWLPANVWRDRADRAYVPPRYAICYSRERAPVDELHDRELVPSDLLALLPPAARDLLRRAKRYKLGRGWFVTCSEVTIGEARKLHGILRSAGFERDPRATRRFGDGVAENARFRAPRPARWLFISFEPILPHGQWEAMGG
jgi:hypothetical protein